MKVIQLVGRLAGKEVDLPFAEAQACLAAGTASPIDKTPRVKGLRTVGADRLPVAEVIAMAKKGSGVPFLTLKAEAKKWLGDGMPTKKAAIVKALEAL